jgi:hypothetical protein
MNLVGTLTGTFVSEWEMFVPDEDYKAYMDSHPNFDITDVEDAEEMWDHFKSIGCYDEPMHSCDYDTTMVGVEIV